MTDRFAFDVSFVITVFNKAPYLGPMLRSIERQIGDFSREFIFVDDGSTDDSVALIKEATAHWDNVHIISQKNAGPAVATNTGGFAAKGEFIKIVDADDVMTPFATLRLLETIRQKDIDFLYGRWRYADDPEAESLAEPDMAGDFFEHTIRWRISLSTVWRIRPTSSCAQPFFKRLAVPILNCLFKTCRYLCDFPKIIASVMLMSWPSWAQKKLPVA
mgnify:CR=1 FL=1